MQKHVEEKRERRSHIFAQAEASWYQEPFWVTERLLAVEKFDGGIYDPACGGGRIPIACRAQGYDAIGSDIVKREKHKFEFRKIDFLASSHTDEDFAFMKTAPNIVCNPPFDLIREFAEKSCRLVSFYSDHGKVALICPIRRLPAARWLREIPLRRVLMLTPRPSMPPGKFVKSGGKVTGGKQDFCWLIFSCGGREDRPEIGWLHRDGKIL